MKLVSLHTLAVFTVALVGCGGSDSRPANTPQTTGGDTSYESSRTPMPPPATPTPSDSNVNRGTMDNGATTNDTMAGGSNASPTSGPSSTKDSSFTDGEIAGIVMTLNAGEVEEGKLAQQKAKNAKVKQFAGMMVTQHTTSNQKQADLLKKMQVVTVETPTSKQLASDGANNVESLKSMSGTDFDKAYMDAMVKEHQNALSMIDDKLIPQAKTPELKAHLQTVRAAVDSHLRQAMEIQKALGTR